MGFASYFEAISLRHAEAEVRSEAFVSPAGMLQPELAPALSAAYSRLRSYYIRISPDIVEQYQRGEWQTLSDRMDSISIVDPRNWTTTLSRIPGRIGPVFGRKAWQRSGDGSRRR